MKSDMICRRPIRLSLSVMEQYLHTLICEGTWRPSEMPFEVLKLELVNNSWLMHLFKDFRWASGRHTLGYIARHDWRKLIKMLQLYKNMDNDFQMKACQRFDHPSSHLRLQIHHDLFKLVKLRDTFLLLLSPLRSVWSTSPSPLSLPPSPTNTTSTFEFLFNVSFYLIMVWQKILSDTPLFLRENNVYLST